MSDTVEKEPMEAMKLLVRQRIRLAWQIAELGGPLESDDAVLVKAMRQHPEYTDLWGQLDQLSDDEIERDGVDPIMHITIHQTIENQIAQRNPKEVSEVMRSLLRQGYSRHEAIHAVGNVMAEEIYYMMRDKREFDEAVYLANLRRLTRKKR